MPSGTPAWRTTWDFRSNSRASLPVGVGRREPGSRQPRHRLLNVRHDNDVTRATVFVPDGKLDHFENLIAANLERRTDSIGRRETKGGLLDAIQQIG